MGPLKVRLRQSGTEKMPYDGGYGRSIYFVLITAFHSVVVPVPMIAGYVPDVLALAADPGDRERPINVGAGALYLHIERSDV